MLETNLTTECFPKEVLDQSHKSSAAKVIIKIYLASETFHINDEQTKMSLMENSFSCKMVEDNRSSLFADVE